MSETTLIKRSPLSEAYLQRGAEHVEAAGWQIAAHAGDPEGEKEHLQTGSVLADWSHVGKISLRGKGAPAEAAKVDPRAGDLNPLQAYGVKDHAVLKLTADEFLVLCQPGEAESLLARFDAVKTSVLDQTGAMGCLALGGAQRDLVIERSTAMNLGRDRQGSGSVVQTTFHMINCTLLRTASLDILLHSRDLSESLFAALWDVGKGVGLTISGIATIPVSFEIGL